jgi:hypothetical protein
MRFQSPLWTEVLKTLLKLVVLAPVVLAFFVQLHLYRSPPPAVPELSFKAPGREHRHVVAVEPKTPDQTTIILIATFGATACLGAASLLFQYALRRCEHTTSVIFFGVVGLLMVVNVVSEVLDSGLRADMRVDYALMLATFTVSVRGVWFESCRQKRVYETKTG